MSEEYSKKAIEYLEKEHIYQLYKTAIDLAEIVVWEYDVKQHRIFMPYFGKEIKDST